MYFYSLFNTQFFQLVGGIVSGLISSFKARVSADGGQFEAEACLETILNKFNSIQ